jgi:SPP1 family predicted phage head-tail adaptor
LYFSDRIILRKAEIKSRNENGYPVTTHEDIEVWANVKSVTRSEFYAANANSINAAISFEIHAEDWGGQTQVIYNTKTYYIIRSYQKGLGVVELICSDKVVQHGKV